MPHGGAVVVPAHAYNGTTALLDQLASTGAAVVRRVDPTDQQAVRAALEGAAMLWVESPTNPMLEVSDIRALAAMAREAGALTVCDNTFATPLVQQPLADGVDVVLHSVTKYLSGHSDVILGALVTPSTDAGRELAGRLATARLLNGAIAGPMETWLALRGPADPARAARARHRQRPRARRAPRGAPRRRAGRATPGFGAIIAIEVAGRRRREPSGSPRPPSCGPTPPASAASSHRSSGAAATRPSRPPSRRPCCGCRSASRTSRTSGTTWTKPCGRARGSH